MALEEGDDIGGRKEEIFETHGNQIMGGMRESDEYRMDAIISLIKITQAFTMETLQKSKPNLQDVSKNLTLYGPDENPRPRKIQEAPPSTRPARGDVE